MNQLDIDRRFVCRFSIISNKRLGYYLYLVPEKIYDELGIYELSFGNTNEFGILCERINNPSESILLKEVLGISHALRKEDRNRILALSKTRGTPMGAIMKPHHHSFIISSSPKKTTRYYINDIEMKPAQKKLFNELLDSKDKPVIFVAKTGFGKTEVYLHYIIMHLNQGGNVLVVLPEIILVWSTWLRLSKRLPNVMFWSGSSTKSEKLKVLRALSGPTPTLVISTRSLLTASIPNLSLIVFDEAHEASNNQTEWPYYNVWDLVNEYQLMPKMVYVTATPNTELWNKYTLCKMKLIGEQPSYGLNCHNVYQESNLPSKTMLLFLKRAQIGGKNSLLYINHRGYASRILDNELNRYIHCIKCGGNLVYHKNFHRWICHSCDAKYPIGCKTLCRNEYSYIGVGVESIYEHLSRYFPKESLAWISSDIATKSYRDSIIKRITFSKGLILISTQIFIKGYHLPSVDRVAMMSLINTWSNRDSSLMAGFIQAAGRSSTGNVLLQLSRDSRLAPCLRRRYIDILEEESKRLSFDELSISWVVSKQYMLRLLKILIEGFNIKSISSKIVKSNKYKISLNISKNLLKSVIAVLPTHLMAYDIVEP